MRALDINRERNNNFNDSLRELERPMAAADEQDARKRALSRARESEYRGGCNGDSARYA